MDDKELFISRIKDLDNISFNRNVRKHTGFLTASELAAFYCAVPQLHGAFYISGGHEDFDRGVIIWPADYESIEDAEKDIISCIKVTPANSRFADELTHRDYLVALMNLGIDRSCVGDILTDKETKEAFIYVLSDMRDYVAGSLTKVRHTDVNTVSVSLNDCSILPDLKEEKLNVISERADAVISAVFKLSRNLSGELISSEKVFIDGKTAKNPGVRLTPGCKVSVRGQGKFIYDGIEGESRKGRLYVKIRLYV